MMALMDFTFKIWNLLCELTGLSEKVNATKQLRLQFPNRKI